MSEAARPGTHALELTPRQARRAIAAATIGNGLEFYDFITYAFFAIQIGRTFFPSDSAFASLMASLVTFGAGFVTRPLGAYVLGHYADKHGRKPSMLVSMLLMGTGMLMLVLTPGYATIGIVAPIVAVCARLLQGFALGGEVGSATSYLIECAPPEKRALTVSWQGASQNVAATLGSLVGLGLSLILSDGALTAYGWRIALAIGASIVPFALWIRSTLPETLHKAREPDEVRDLDFRGYAKVLVLGFLMIGAGTIATYVFQYIATFGQNTLRLSTPVSMAAEFGNNFVAVVLVLWGGWVADRWGRKRLMVWPQLLFVLAIVPVFLWITGSGTPFAFVTGVVILSTLSNAQYAGVYAAINESLPRAVRARAFALVYSLPVTILGGTTQPFVAWLLHVTGKPIALAWYLTGVSVVGLVAMMLMHETSPRHKLTPPQIGEPVPL
jgi:MHS family citrate/tricarballylate:H+ symporter-like MFS transporter